MSSNYFANYVTLDGADSLAEAAGRLFPFRVLFFTPVRERSRTLKTT
jgi:hypothetical protein